MSDESYDSLFDAPYSSDEELEPLSLPHEHTRAQGLPSKIPPHDQEEPIAICGWHASPVPGLYFHSQLKITKEMESYLLESLERNGYFARPDVNQVMLFGRPRGSHATQHISVSKHDQPSLFSESSGLPVFLEQLLEELKQTLSSPLVPPDVQRKLFHHVDDQARQAILNRYNVGEGIKAHIDLPNRFADGIIVVSLKNGICMDFAHEAKREAHSVWLPPRSIVILEGEARWEWTHGIVGRQSDVVDVTGVEAVNILGADQAMHELPGRPNIVEIPRQLRTSITLRWMLPGANVVGA